MKHAAISGIVQQTINHRQQNELLKALLRRNNQSYFVSKM
jgi:hypothetical protein